MLPSSISRSIRRHLILSKGGGKATQGLTLMEIVVSFGILALLFLSLSYLFINLLGASAKSANKTAALIFAEEVMESVIRKESFVSITEPVAEHLSTTSSEQPTQFFYTVDCQVIPEQHLMHADGYFVTVRVTWWDEDPQAERAGQGKLSAEVGRLHVPKFSSASSVTP